MTRQIREQLNALIDAGTLAAGTLLPSERELANTLDVARNVVRGAYEQLMDAGKIRSEVGRAGACVVAVALRKSQLRPRPQRQLRPVRSSITLDRPTQVPLFSRVSVLLSSQLAFFA